MTLRLLVALFLISTNLIFSQKKIEVFTPAKGDVIIGTPVNGTIDNGVYTCNRFDWKIKIPEGFKVTDIERLQELERKGNEAISNNTGIPASLDTTIHLVGFEIDARNCFLSNIESLYGKKQMTLQEHKIFASQILKDSYAKIEGIKFELTESDIKIGSHDFYVIKVNVYAPRTNMLLLSQEIYNSYIDNYLFSAVVNYSNKDTGDLLRNNFINSLK